MAIFCVYCVLSLSVKSPCVLEKNMLDIVSLKDLLSNYLDDLTVEQMWITGF